LGEILPLVAVEGKSLSNIVSAARQMSMSGITAVRAANLKVP